MRQYRSAWAARQGATALEFALVLPVFIALLLFIFDISMVLWAKGTMQLAASQTARCTAISSPACTNPQAFASALLSDWGTNGIVPSISVAVQSGTTCNNEAGHFSMVTITGVGPSLMAINEQTMLITSACYPSGI